MRPLGIDLGVIGSPIATIGPPSCPGASLRLNRDEMYEYEKGGEKFVTPRNELPFDARGDARVRCSGLVEQVMKPTHGTQYYGLCSSCSGLETRHRAALRELAKQAPR